LTQTGQEVREECGHHIMAVPVPCVIWDANEGSGVHLPIIPWDSQQNGMHFDNL
jgi:hypothetical protein